MIVMAPTRSQRRDEPGATSVQAVSSPTGTVLGGCDHHGQGWRLVVGSISSPRQGERSVKCGFIQAVPLAAAGDGDGDRAGGEATCNIRPRSRQKSGLMACMPAVWLRLRPDQAGAEIEPLNPQEKGEGWRSQVKLVRAIKAHFVPSGLWHFLHCLNGMHLLALQLLRE